MPPESDAPGNEPNLELPSFGFGRKKKRDRKAEKGSGNTPTNAAALLRRNLLVYGLGGIVVPFLGIKAIDLLVTLLPGL